jgi:hypothetical protein
MLSVVVAIFSRVACVSNFYFFRRSGPSNLSGATAIVSGADHIPVQGFDRPASINFHSPTANVRRLPFASTCDIRLFLPRGVHRDELGSMMEQSVLESHGFRLH